VRARALAVLRREADEIRQLAVKAEQFGPAVSAVREKGVLSGQRIDRSAHLVRAQHEIISEMADFELFERQITSLLSQCRGLGLDPESCSFRDFVGGLMEQYETEENEAEPPKYRHMGTLSDEQRGHRAPDFRKQKQAPKIMTRGEAEKMKRKLNGGGKGAVK
jgi:hypothetical protein